MAAELIRSVDKNVLLLILRQLGLEAEPTGQDDRPCLVSRMNDVSFDIHLGTKIAGRNAWTDFTFSAPFDVDEDVSPVVASSWNRRWRHGRACRIQNRIYLEQDIVVAGGVSLAAIRSQLDIWSHLTRGFVQHLKADHLAFARYRARQANGEAGESRIRERA